MITFSNNTCPIQKFINFSPFRFYLHDSYCIPDPDDVYPFIQTFCFFVADDPIIRERLVENGFKLENETAEVPVYVAPKGAITYVCEICNAVEKRRQFEDLFGDFFSWHFEEVDDTYKKDLFYQLLKGDDDSADYWKNQCVQFIDGRELPEIL